MFRQLLEVSQATWRRAQSNDGLMLLLADCGEIIREQKAGMLSRGRLLPGEGVK